MKSFKEYMLESKAGTYAAVRPLHPDAQHLKNVMKDYGVPNPEKADKLHCTLLYSRKHLPNYVPDTSMTHVVCVSSLEMWLTRSGKNCLVMKLDAPSLIDRHKDLMTMHDAEYDYPEYKPHVSLSYDIGDYDITELKKNLPKTFILSHEYQEQLDTIGK